MQMGEHYLIAARRFAINGDRDLFFRASRVVLSYLDGSRLCISAGATVKRRQAQKDAVLTF
jgi:hypothetical protein